MKKLFLATCLLLSAAASFSQSVFKGKVTDATTGLPVPQATIELQNGTSLVADDNGLFSASLKKSTQQVQISASATKRWNNSYPLTNTPQPLSLHLSSFFCNR